MKKLIAPLAFAAAAIAAATAVPAAAAVVTFTYAGDAFDENGDQTGEGVDYSVQFTIADFATVVDGRNGYLVTAASGFRNEIAISGVLAQGSYLNSNYLFFSDPLFGDAADGEGIGLQLANGTSALLYTSGGNYLDFVGDSTGNFIAGSTGNAVVLIGGEPSGPVTPPTSPVPEPAAWALMVAGFGMAGAALRRRPRVAVSFG